MAVKTGNMQVAVQNVAGGAFKGKITDCKYAVYIGVPMKDGSVRLLPNCSLGFDPRQAKTGDQIMEAILGHMVKHATPKSEGLNWQPFDLFGKKFYVALVEKAPKQKMTAEEVDAAWG